MRPIKFRAYDKTNKEMMNDVSIVGSHIIFEYKHGGYDLNELELTYLDILDGPNKYEIMQYTGLKDPRGNTVCEGDVVDCLDGEYSFRGIVVKDTWSFYIKGIDPKDNFNFEDYSDRDKTDLWVIGNIYEDKHLLEVQT